MIDKETLKKALENVIEIKEKEFKESEKKFDDENTTEDKIHYLSNMNYIKGSIHAFKSVIEIMNKYDLKEN